MISFSEKMSLRLDQLYDRDIFFKFFFHKLCSSNAMFFSIFFGCELITNKHIEMSFGFRLCSSPVQYNTIQYNTIQYNNSIITIGLQCRGIHKYNTLPFCFTKMRIYNMNLRLQIESIIGIEVIMFCYNDQMDQV